MTCRGSSGPAEVPAAAVYVGASPGGEPDLKERVGSSCVGLCVGVYCPEPLLGQWAAGDCLCSTWRDLPSVYGCGMGMGSFDSKHVFIFQDCPLKTHVA